MLLGVTSRSRSSASPAQAGDLHLKTLLTQGPVHGVWVSHAGVEAGLRRGETRCSLGRETTFQWELCLNEVRDGEWSGLRLFSNFASSSAKA